VLALTLGLVANGPAMMAGSTNSFALPATSAAFPLHAAPGARFLRDASGKPFLVHGEAAWSLIAQLTRESADLYFKDRQARGFNTVLVSLIEHKFATNAPANIYGQPPFLRTGDFSTPNAEYFDHADWIVQRAAEAGMLVFLAPCYTGSGGGPEGWYREMKINGAAKLHEYGQYLGQRYQRFKNIVWVHGGDYNPPNKALVRAVAEGIRERDPVGLHSAQCAPETPAVRYWQGEDWLNLNSIYTYRPIYSAALAQYAHPERLPFFLIESTYENEHDVTEERLRSQAYYALLSGAAGQIFGNNPIWHFDGPGLYPAPVNWQQAMASRGTQSMTHLLRLFSALPWWLLEPDSRNFHLRFFLSDGLGSGFDRAVAACSSDRTFAVAYIPSVRGVILDLSQLVGPNVIARWYDPSIGRFFESRGSPFSNLGPQYFTPTGRNSTEGEDWVLVLESRS
jgi:hypothetical protein